MLTPDKLNKRIELFRILLIGMTEIAKMEICIQFFFDYKGFIPTQTIAKISELDHSELIEKIVNIIFEKSGVNPLLKRIPSEIYYPEKYFNKYYPAGVYSNDNVDWGYNLSFLYYLANPEIKSSQSDDIHNIITYLRDERIRNSETNSTGSVQIGSDTIQE